MPMFPFQLPGHVVELDLSTRHLAAALGVRLVTSYDPETNLLPVTPARYTTRDRLQSFSLFINTAHAQPDAITRFCLAHVLAAGLAWVPDERRPKSEGLLRFGWECVDETMLAMGYHRN